MEAKSEAGEWLQEETGALGQRWGTHKGIEGSTFMVCLLGALLTDEGTGTPRRLS